MKKHITIINFLLFFYISSSAQTSWQGNIVNEDGAPIEFVNILLLNAQDSTFQKGALTNEAGIFTISSNNSNKEILKISLLGYEDRYIELSKDYIHTLLGTIALSENVMGLDEVQVVAKKPLFEQQVDRTIVNVENSVINAGNNALSILSRSPSVVVDRSNEEIQLMGNQGVVIMINNKPIRMEVAELISFLESMPSDNIKNIELITNPPSSYDAQGNAGIININTKKATEEGIIGNLALNGGYGVEPKYGASLNLNYNKGKLNLYTNLSANVNHSIEEQSGEVLFKLGESLVNNHPKTKRDYQVGLYSGEVGMDVYLHKNHSLGAFFSVQYRDWQMDSYANTDRTTDGILVNIVNHNTEVNELFRTLSNINYKNQVTPTGELSFDYDYIRFKRKNPTDYLISTTMPDLPVQEHFSRSGSETPLDIHVAAINYKDKPIESLEWETGVKWTTSVFENYLSFEDQINGLFTVNPLFTDNFFMDENIYATYLSIGWDISKKLQFKGGARYEYYQIDLRSNENGDLLNRENGRLYPNLFLRYNLSEQVDLNLSYSERVERPGFLTLAPAFYFYDQYSLFTGNPTIIPTIAKRIKFDMRYKTININVLYANFENPVFQLQPDVDDELDLFITRPLQANKGNALSISTSFPFQITKKWNSRVNANFNRLDQRPIIEGVTIENINFNYNILLTNNYQLFENLEVELNGQYYSKFQYSVAAIKARWSLDFGLRKKFKGGQSLAFNAIDIFNTLSQYEVAFDAAAANIQYNALFDIEGPVFRMSFSMPFGNRNLKNRATRESRSDEEQQRLN